MLASRAITHSATPNAELRARGDFGSTLGASLQLPTRHDTLHDAAQSRKIPKTARGRPLRVPTTWRVALEPLTDQL